MDEMLVSKVPIIGAAQLIEELQIKLLRMTPEERVKALSDLRRFCPECGDVVDNGKTCWCHPIWDR